MKHATRIGIALGVMFALGCSGYRYVRRTQTGGTIALQGQRDEAMAKAQQAMQAHCGGPYTILEEGEVVVGEDTVARQDTQGNQYQNQQNQTTTASQSSRAATEWRVTYACGTAAPAPAPVAPAPPPGPEGAPPPPPAPAAPGY